MANQNFIIGVKTRFFFGLMPASLLALATPTRPTDVVVTTTSSTNAAATSMAVSALSGPIAKGTPIAMTTAASTVIVTTSATAGIGAVSLAVSALSAAIPSGSIIDFNGEEVVTTANAASGATTISIQPLVYGIASGSLGRYVATTVTPVIVYTTADAATGATSISIEAQTGRTTIASGDVGLHRGVVLLQGGTTSNEQLQSQNTETRVYEPRLPYSTGIITGATWSVSYTTNVLPTDIGFFRLNYAGAYALDGVRGWVFKQDPVPAGYTVGDSIQGLCDVTDFQKTNPADGIITATCTFTGRGAPTIGHAA